MDTDLIHIIDSSCSTVQPADLSLRMVTLIDQTHQMHHPNIVKYSLHSLLYNTDTLLMKRFNLIDLIIILFFKFLKSSDS